MRLNYVLFVAMLSGTFGLAGCVSESAESLLASAKSQIERKDSSAAIIQLKNALQKDPSLAEARALLGKTLLESGDFTGADVELKKAQELGYDPDQVIPLLGKAMLAKGQADKVLAQFGNLNLGTPAAQADLNVVLATAYLTQGKREETNAAINVALQMDPTHIGAQLLRVRMLASGKDIKGASSAINQVIADAPENSEARQLKGEILNFEGQYEAALVAFKEALERDKKNIAAHNSILLILMAKPDIPAAEAQLKELAVAFPKNPLITYFGALIALEKGDIALANERAQQLLKQSPENVRALQLAGIIELRKGAVIQAEANLAKALQLAPDQERVRLLLAQTYLRAGDSARAIKVLQPLISSDESRWEAIALMAQAQLMAGDPTKAERYFSQAAKLNPGDTRSRTALALRHMAGGRVEQGFDELNAIAESDTGATADLALVSAYLRKQDYERALLAIEKLEKKQPKLPLATNLRAKTELQRGRRDQARAAFEASLKIDPSYVPSASGLAAMDLEDGKVEIARQRFEAMLTANPRNVKAGMALLALNAQTGMAKEDLLASVEKLIKANPSEVAPRGAQVSLHIERKDFKAALSAAQNGLAAIPDSIEMLDFLGRAQYLAGEFNQAASTYNKTATMQPNSPVPLMRLSEVYVAQKDFMSAAQSLKKALTINPDYLPAQRALIDVEVSSGRIKSAIGVAKSIQAQSGNEVVGLALEGELESKQRNWAAAAKAYRSALDKKASSELAMKLHRVLSVAGQPEEAARFERLWVKQHPKDAVFAYYLGDFYLANKDYEIAKHHYETVLKLAPNNAPALNNLAWLLSRSKDPAALNLALKATQLAPKEPAFMDTLAKIYASNGQLPKAIEIQKAAVAAGPNIAAHRMQLARYYMAANQKDLAKLELNQLAALGDSFRGHAEVRTMLASL